MVTMRETLSIAISFRSMVPSKADATGMPSNSTSTLRSRKPRIHALASPESAPYCTLTPGVCVSASATVVAFHASKSSFVVSWKVMAGAGSTRCPTTTISGSSCVDLRAGCAGSASPASGRPSAVSRAARRFVSFRMRDLPGRRRMFSAAPRRCGSARTATRASGRRAGRGAARPRRRCRSARARSRGPRTGRAAPRSIRSRASAC